MMLMVFGDIIWMTAARGSKVIERLKYEEMETMVVTRRDSE